MLSAELEKDYAPVINYCFCHDKDLLDKYHVKAPNTLWECVDDTVSKLNQAKDFKFYVIRDEHRGIVGYIGKEVCGDDIFLTSFFIMPYFRTKERVEQFWKIASTFIGDNFMCGIFDKNTRAMNFLKRKGEVVLKDIHEGMEYSVFKIKL